MFNNDKSEEEISTWTATIEGRVSEGDAMITKLTKCVNDLKDEEELRVKEAENVVKNKEREELLRFERAQLEQKLEFEKKIEESKKNQAPAKLAEAKGSETNRRPKTEDRRSKTEDRRPKTEDRRPKSAKTLFSTPKT